MKIGTKFNLLLLLVFVVGISLSGLLLSNALQQRAQAEFTAKASILMQTMNSVRNYTQDRVNPLLQDQLGASLAFNPETVPTFSAREVFEYLRKDPDYRTFLYKDAAPNPTNLRDMANEFEITIIEEFRDRPDLKEKTGFLEFPEGRMFYIARPFLLTKSACLQCHSDPNVAPKSLLATYGSERGFGWQLNQIVATQIVYVPVEEILTSIHRSFQSVMGAVVGMLAIVLLLVNFLLKRTVIQRIQTMTKTAQAVSMGDLEVGFEEQSKDEIGLLALAFNRMKSSLAIAINLINQQKKD